MKNVISIVCVIFVAFVNFAYSQTEANLRLREISRNNLKSVFEIDIRGTTSDFNLAGQNMRLFYDSKNMTFNSLESKTTLPKTSYSEIKVVDDLRGVDASIVGDLAFDKELGYVNFAIDLENLADGGNLVSTQEWTSIAVLSFDRTNNEEPNIIWADRNVTAKYSVGYVQIAEFVNEKQYNAVRPIKSVELLNTSTSGVKFEAQIFPNNVVDFATLVVNDTDFEMIIANANGEVIMKKKELHSKNIKLDLNDSPSGNYFVEVISMKTGKRAINKIIKVSK